MRFVFSVDNPSGDKAQGFFPLMSTLYFPPVVYFKDLQGGKNCHCSSEQSTCTLKFTGKLFTFIMLLKLVPSLVFTASRLPGLLFRFIQTGWASKFSQAFLRYFLCLTSLLSRHHGKAQRGLGLWEGFESRALLFIVYYLRVARQGNSLCFAVWCNLELTCLCGLLRNAILNDLWIDKPNAVRVLFTVRHFYQARSKFLCRDMRSRKHLVMGRRYLHLERPHPGRSVSPKGVLPLTSGTGS